MRTNELKKDIGVLGLLLVCLSLPVLFRELLTVDELWNYSFAKNLYDGLLPYRDYNMITTPLSPAIAALFFNILGDSLMTMRILSLVMAVCTFFVFHKILRRLQCHMVLSVVMAVFAAMFYGFTFSYNYNYWVLLFLMTIMYLEIVQCENNDGERKERLGYLISLGIGVLAALAFLTKQSTGAMLILAVMINCLWQRKLSLIKWRMCGAAVPLFFFAIWLAVNDNFLPFWEYAVTGIAKFTHSISYWDFLHTGFVNLFLGLSVPAVLALSVRYAFKHEGSSKWLMCRIVTLTCAGMIVLYPITDPEHFYIGAFPATVLLFKLLQGKVRIRYPQYSWICILIAAGFFSVGLYVKFDAEPDNVVFSQLHHFQGIRMDSSLQDTILEVDRFILAEKEKGNEVYILDDKAAAYMLPIDTYRANYDFFLNGNIGNKTPNQYIKREFDS